MKVFIGHDNRQPDASTIAHSSLMRRSSIFCEVTLLKHETLAAQGLLRRPTDRRNGIYDIPSNAPASTDFAISRFLTPILAQSGWALFVDADIVFMDDVADIFDHADPRYAVQVVKHGECGTQDIKMDGCRQLSYPRKNWSSVMLFNCDHPANRRLSLQDVNERRGFDLHQFYWLADSEIGSLPKEWNWLVNVEPEPAHPKIAHFTLGGPFISGWHPAEHDEIWTNEYERFRRTIAARDHSKAAAASVESAAVSHAEVGRSSDDSGEECSIGRRASTR